MDLENPATPLKGVEVIGDILIDGSGRKNFRFKCPITEKSVSSISYRKHYQKLGTSIEKVILSINGIDESNHPKCCICKTSLVRVGRIKPGSILIDPLLLQFCNNSSCGLSFGTSRSNKSKLAKGWRPPGPQNMSKEELIQRSKKAAKTQLEKGIFLYQNESKDDKYLRYSKLNKTKWKNGTHPFCKFINKRKEFSYRGKTYYFRSSPEYQFFKKYKNLLIKFYDYESLRVSYFDNKGSHSYIPDFSLKSEFKGSGLPDIIEVKGGNLKEYNGKDVSEVNYRKFKSVIDSGMYLLLVNYVSSKNSFSMNKIKSLNELNCLFKEISYDN